LKVISSDIDKKRGTHFLYYEEDSYDGRNSLIQSIKKAGNIFDLSYPLYGDLGGYKRHINNILSKKETKISPEAMSWLVDNPPILRIKSKSANNKKEVLVYDIDLLSQEISKICSYTNLINVDDFANCLLDIALCVAYCKPETLIVIDDYNYPPVTEAARRFLSSLKLCNEFISDIDQGIFYLK
jgi:hypothetical protein